MLGVTEAQRKHKDTQKAGHCMATTDHKVRRGWRAQPVAAASACPARSERQLERRTLLQWQISTLTP